MVRLPRWLLPVVVPVGVCMLALYAYHEAVWGPIGQASDEFPPVPSGYGDVATTRTEDGLLWAAARYFVFVHAAGKPDTHDNLVFRYSGTEASPPRITWINRFAVKIAVDEPGEISLLQSYTGSISISYALGHEVH